MLISSPPTYQPLTSPGQVYTSLNATSKGVSLGIYDRSALDGQTGGINGAGSAQPFVDLMGRKVSLKALHCHPSSTSHH